MKPTQFLPMLKYQALFDLNLKVSHQERALLPTSEGGKVALDAKLLSLLQLASGRELNEILDSFAGGEATPDAVRAALACLAEAGLLTRLGETPTRPTPQPAVGPLVSAVIVTYNSQEWLGECLPSLFSQSYSELEVIAVDNASSDGSADWLKMNCPQVRLLRLDRAQSLAYAINQGVALAKGTYFLLLNPDVRLQPDAIAHMVATAQDDPSCAAVTAKLKFWWAPAFLNGLGNRVEAFSWGTDNAVGHLDLGQFDSWCEVPSACFAAALIPRAAWDRVGPLDSGFPLYYEDSEWSYRARLLGYTVRAAPQAVIYHAFGGRVPSGAEDGLTPRKLRQVAYGRLRFATKILSQTFLRRFLRNYLREDCRNFSRALRRREWATARAYLSAWWDSVRGLPALMPERRALQARRARSDEELFALQQGMPAPLMWHGLPELTWDLVLHHYLPLFHAGKTRPVPEFQSDL